MDSVLKPIVVEPNFRFDISTYKFMLYILLSWENAQGKSLEFDYGCCIVLYNYIGVVLICYGFICEV